MTSLRIISSPSKNTLDITSDQYDVEFLRISQYLLNDCILVINKKEYRLVEIEFYYTDDHHNDPFTHQHEIQRDKGKWYFHRAGSNIAKNSGSSEARHGYKNGTFKGLDISIGNSISYGGILIRTIKSLIDGSLIEGPSLTVDHIIHLNECQTIDEFVTSKLHNNLSIDNKLGPLYLSDRNINIKEHDFQSRQIIKCPRVGLSLKKSVPPIPDQFIFRKYRFLTCPHDIKKGKYYIILGLSDSYPDDKLKIYKLTGTPLKTISKYLELVHHGKLNKSRDHINSFYSRQLTTDDICELYGCVAE